MMKLSKKIHSQVESLVRERFGESFESLDLHLDDEEHVLTVYVITKPRDQTVSLFGLTGQIRSVLGDGYNGFFPVIRSGEVHA